MIPGFMDGLKQLRLGSKARLYIPSALAYGANGRTPKIKPNENLIFDITVVSLVTSPKNSPMSMGGPGGMKMTPELMAKIRAMQQAQQQKGAAAGH